MVDAMVERLVVSRAREWVVVWVASTVDKKDETSVDERVASMAVC